MRTAGVATIGFELTIADNDRGRNQARLEAVAAIGPGGRGSIIVTVRGRMYEQSRSTVT